MSSTALGIFGGTFDPPHLGHIAAARRCREALGLDKVLLVVANDPWQKSPERSVSPAKDRLAMVEASVKDIEGLEACSLEIDRGGPSYTIDTVEELARTEGVVMPWVIVGADLAATLDTWERANELRSMVRIAVMSRPGSPLHLPEGWRAVALESDDLDISSSSIREALHAGESVADLVPEGVIRHLGDGTLYA